jgi:hypothetical protein
MSTAARSEEPVIIPASTAMMARDQHADLPALPMELEGFTGFEGIDPSNFIIPRIKIVQPTSKEGTAGTFRVNLTGDEFKELDIIAVKAVMGRVMWDKANPGNDKALCRSFDFLRPDSSIEDPPSSECARYVMGTNKKQILKPICSKGQWFDKERPECSETFNLLCVLAEDQLPFWISLHGSSISNTKKFLSAIALRRGILWHYVTTISLEERKEPHRHYVCKFSAPQPITKEFEAQIAPIVAGLKDADLKRTMEAEEAAAAGEEGSPDATDASQGVDQSSEPDWMKD